MTQAHAFFAKSMTISNLEPLGPTRTRLVTRYRAAHDASLRMAAFTKWMAVLHAFMEKKQLRTIKQHAEHC